ncbi:hypothetical protein CPC08DRAFT_340685 [Agrocybe pediades]|nr:hypothetical protein CPC08DRAFT_340685 [Agrocybe pediades]
MSSFVIGDSTNTAITWDPPLPKVWPKRISKACARCRSNKVKCDGLRPCGACAKKGLRADQCTEGCEACRRARVKCEDGKPCKRCLAMGLECREEGMIPPPVAPPTTTTTSAVDAPTRANDRAKIACLSCRRDNKKCDDQRPCSRCIARNDECVRLARGPRPARPRCAGCKEDDLRCEDSRPCTQCIESSRTCTLISRKGRGLGTRAKAACTACRQDKVRCNGERPCAACDKKGRQCVYRTCEACLQGGKLCQCRVYSCRSEDRGSGGTFTSLAGRPEGIAVYKSRLDMSYPVEFAQEYTPPGHPQEVYQTAGSENYGIHRWSTTSVGPVAQVPSTSNRLFTRATALTTHHMSTSQANQLNIYPIMNGFQYYGMQAPGLHDSLRAPGGHLHTQLLGGHSMHTRGA